MVVEIRKTHAVELRGIKNEVITLWSPFDSFSNFHG